MNISIVLFIVILISAFLGIIYGKKLYNKNINITSWVSLSKVPMLKGIFNVFVFIITFHVISLKSSSFTWHFPIYFQYYYMSIINCFYMFFLVFFLVFIIYLAFKNQYSKRYFLASFGIIITIIYFNVFVLNEKPIYKNLEKEIIKDGIIMQTSSSSCTAASCANIVNFYGLKKTEKDMAELFKTSIKGTSESHMILGMKKLGFKYKRRNIKDADIDKLSPLSVLSVNSFNNIPECHAVAYIKKTNDKYEIWDPLQGKKIMTKDEVRNIWLGKAVEFSKNV